MAVKIRLARVGKKKYPVYRVVVADSRSPRNGKFIEIIGQYQPMQTPAFVNIDSEKALKWLAEGAEPSDITQKIMRENGVWKEFDPKDSKDVSRRYLNKIEASKKINAAKIAEAEKAKKAEEAAKKAEEAAKKAEEAAAAKAEEANAQEVAPEESSEAATEASE